MKIRLDFVTNSSSSSFVCVNIKSDKLKELLERYDVQYWDYSDGCVSYDDEDVSCTATSFDNVAYVLDWFVEFLSFLNPGNSFIGEYKENRDNYLGDVEIASYEIDDTNTGEFEGNPERHDYFEYIKGVVDDAKLKESLKNIKNFDLSNIRMALKEKWLGQLHIYFAEDNTEVVLVREPDNSVNTYAIFVETKEHKYMGYLDGMTAECLAPILDSGQYKYRAKLNKEKKTVSVEIKKTEDADREWKLIKTGSPKIEEEELESIRSSFASWADELKKRYATKKLPNSINTLLKNGSVEPFVVKQWAQAFEEDLEVILSREGLLSGGTNKEIDSFRWNKGDESDHEYYQRIMAALEKLQVKGLRDLDFEGKVFVNRTRRYGAWSQTDGYNPVVLSFTRAGAIHEQAVTDKTDYLVAGKPDGETEWVDKQWVEALKRIDKRQQIKIILIKQLENETGLNEEKALQYRKDFFKNYSPDKDVDIKDCYYVKLGRQKDEQ